MCVIVFRGREAVKNEKIFEEYKDTHLSMDLLDPTQKVHTGV